MVSNFAFDSNQYKYEGIRGMKLAWSATAATAELVLRKARHCMAVRPQKCFAVSIILF
jgi:hypothetical protein